LRKPIRGRSYGTNCWFLLVSHKCDGTHAPGDRKQPCWPYMANWVHTVLIPRAQYSPAQAKHRSSLLTHDESGNVSTRYHYSAKHCSLPAGDYVCQ